MRNEVMWAIHLRTESKRVVSVQRSNEVFGKIKEALEMESTSARTESWGSFRSCSKEKPPRQQELHFLGLNLKDKIEW